MTDLQLPVITIDGPAGSGKTTVSWILALRLGLVVLDTGLFYRAVAWTMACQRLDAKDECLAAEVASSLKLDVVPDNTSPNGQRVFVNGERVNGHLYSPEVEKIVSDVALHPKVRYILLPKQRETLEMGGVIVAGRDTGSVVWPEAELKIYLDASIEVRACRKHREKQRDEGESDYARILALMQNRDRIDSGRKVAPLKIPDGALVVDTDPLTAEEVAEHIMIACHKLTDFNLL